MPDVTIENHGSVFAFVLHTDAAMEFVREEVQLEDYQWMGNSSFAVEHRFAHDLADGMAMFGLEVQ